MLRVYALLLGLAGFFPTVANAATSDIAAITKLEKGLAAVQEPGQLTQFFSENCVLYEGMAPGIYHGRSAIIAAFTPQMTGLKSISITFRELDVEASGDLGTAYSIQHAVVLPISGAVRQVTWRQTDILHKDSSGRWWITHEHVSYPVDPKSGMAVFDQ